jgi:hypothetical protein
MSMRIVQRRKGKKRPAYAGLEGVNTEKFNAGEMMNALIHMR